MSDYYYSPFQYELREWLPEYGPRTGSALTRVGIPAPVVTGLGLTVGFLAYTPLLQPGPPVRRGDQFTLQPISLGGGLIV